MKGHYASQCPYKGPLFEKSSGKAINHPAPTRPAYESASKKQATGGRMYAIDIDNADLPGPFHGPIASM